jgi:hypothetical protein
MGAEVVTLPLVSYALQANVRLPFGMVAVLYVILYGVVVAVPMRTVPSHQNSTRLTPTSSLAFAVNVAVAVRVAPPLGAVRLAVGGLSTVAAA